MVQNAPSIVPSGIYRLIALQSAGTRQAGRRNGLRMTNRLWRGDRSCACGVLVQGLDETGFVSCHAGGTRCTLGNRPFVVVLRRMYLSGTVSRTYKSRTAKGTSRPRVQHSLLRVWAACMPMVKQELSGPSSVHRASIYKYDPCAPTMGLAISRERVDSQHRLYASGAPCGSYSLTERRYHQRNRNCLATLETKCKSQRRLSTVVATKSIYKSGRRSQLS
ncbi:hypothetical protein GY45DRAFT_334010 [Cubamyces sp. BRFM 1775]|nr:hypothetical protein GY45DRAFT_334010 [Cubamyces sp. BRFM 1775]